MCAVPATNCRHLQPPLRWLLMGPARSGTEMHVDPANTGAWNAVTHGPSTRQAPTRQAPEQLPCD